MFQKQEHSITHHIQAVLQFKFHQQVNRLADFLYILPLKDKTFKGDNMVYKIRLKAREKQAECSTILFLSFLVLVLTVFSSNLLPAVYSSLTVVMKTDIIIDLIASGLIFAFSLSVYSALSMGVDRFMLKRAENISSGAGDIFHYFAPKKFISMCAFNISLSVRKSLLLILMSLPAVICACVFFVLSDNGFSAAVCGVFAAFTLMFIIYEILTYRRIADSFFIARYLFIKGEYINIKQLIAVSQNNMSSEVKQLRRLRLSFAGWFLLCLTVFPLPYVWAYYRQSKACFAAQLINR